MKNIVRQIAVVLITIITITINILANALPINGLNTGQISDTFKVFFVPAGYVFSIWGIIYIGLIAYAVYQALPAQRENPRLQATGWWVVLGGLANCAWIFLWQYEHIRLDGRCHADPAGNPHRGLSAPRHWADESLHWLRPGRCASPSASTWAGSPLPQLPISVTYCGL